MRQAVGHEKLPGMRNFLRLTAFLLLATPAAFAAELPVRPAVAVANDGFPTGTDTPEGAACDFARAFIRNDPMLLLATCIEPFGTPEARKAYHDFLKEIVIPMKVGDPASEPLPVSPKRIDKCFAARHLSKGGPASWGYAAYGFQDVMFVDVDSVLQNDGTQLCRTLVIKTKEGKWTVDPQPEADPLLSTGLDDEPASTQDFTEAYTVAPPGAPAASPALRLTNPDKQSAIGS